MHSTHEILFRDSGRNTVLMDSISYVTDANRGDIVISGSHGGTSSAGYAIEARVAAAFFNDAGCGKNNAGIKGLQELEKHAIIAIAASHESAEIAHAADTWKNGIVTHINKVAEKAGIHAGMRVSEAVDILRACLKSKKS